MVRFNGSGYFYVYNLQGDVAALIDADSTRMVEYVYDAWGYLISKTGKSVSDDWYVESVPLSRVCVR